MRPCLGARGRSVRLAAFPALHIAADAATPIPVYVGAPRDLTNALLGGLMIRHKISCTVIGKFKKTAYIGGPGPRQPRFALMARNRPVI